MAIKRGKEIGLNHRGFNFNELGNEFKDESICQNVVLSVNMNCSQETNSNCSGNENSCIKFFHHNIQYISGKQDEIEILLSVLGPDIAVCTEHGLNEEKILQYNYPWFVLGASFYRTAYKSGGIAIFVKNLPQNNYKRLNFVSQYCEEMNIELAGITFNNGLKVMGILGVYRSPPGNKDIFMSKLFAVLDELCKKFDTVAILGDFNIDINFDDRYSSDFRDLIGSFNLEFKILLE